MGLLSHDIVAIAIWSHYQRPLTNQEGFGSKDCIFQLPNRNLYQFFVPVVSYFLYQYLRDESVLNDMVYPLIDLTKIKFMLMLLVLYVSKINNQK